MRHQGSPAGGGQSGRRTPTAMILLLATMLVWMATVVAATARSPFPPRSPNPPPVPSSSVRVGDRNADLASVGRRTALRLYTNVGPAGVSPEEMRTFFDDTRRALAGAFKVSAPCSLIPAPVVKTLFARDMFQSSSC